MVSQVQQSIKSWVHCLQHEGNLPKVPLHPIVATAPMDLLHVDFTNIEMTMELNWLPKVTNVLVLQDHFTKYIMAYVTPYQTAKMVAKFLYQGYISIFGEIVDHAIPPTDERVGGEITSNHNVNDQEAGRRQKGQLARTSGWNNAHLQCHPICCDGV